MHESNQKDSPISKEEYLKIKYPRMKRNPDPSCKKCGGNGEIEIARYRPDNGDPIKCMLPCLCIYFELRENKFGV